MVGNILSYIFPGGRALKLIKNGVNITNSTNPFQVTKNVTLTVIDCCAPPPVRLAAHCIALVSLVVITVSTPPTPGTPVIIGSTIAIATEIYEQC